MTVPEMPVVWYAGESVRAQCSTVRDFASRGIELRHLRYFLAVAEELHFRRAAARLGIAQPALSVAIRRLEREVGMPLFIRTTRRVRLTQAGLVLARDAHRVTEELDRLVSEARQAAG